MSRLLMHGVLGWTLCAATMAALLSAASLTMALVVHAIAAPLFFTVIAWHYFNARGARDPVQTALAWTAVVAMLDLVVVAGGVQRSLAMFASVAGTWLPLALIFLSVSATGAVMSLRSRSHLATRTD
jgi:hypothetical protein